MAETAIPYGLKALSVRQPWAWAIFNGKDVENRSQASLRYMNFAGVERIAIHAAKGMTQDEYDDAASFMRGIGVACPPAIGLARAGIIGTARVVGIARESKSPWFFGPRAIVLADPEPCEFIPVVGQLGLFDWTPAGPAIVPPAARWMLAGRQSKSAMEQAAKEPGLPL
ncbi:MAG TPA: hypothetical protein VIF40_17830 [Methylosinus sp.]|jgi:hypothetical protein|uniref:hypothetical protein n=1 Tax=Methylosinus sp. TaxID=427 RepID=UPI002F9371CA